MANIKVPIGRGIIGQVQQEQFTKEPEKKATNDIEFRRILADQGKLFSNHGTRTAVGAVVEIIIPNGSTFYLLKATAIVSAIGTTAVYNLTSVINGVTTIENDNGGLGPINLDLTIEGFSIIGNGANLLRINQTTGNVLSNAVIQGYLEPTITTSSRGSTSAL